MITLIKRFSRFEKKMDDLMETFIFRHKCFGFFIVFVGMPLVTLAVVCISAASCVGVWLGENDLSPYAEENWMEKRFLYTILIYAFRH